MTSTPRRRSPLDAWLVAQALFLGAALVALLGLRHRGPLGLAAAAAAVATIVWWGSNTVAHNHIHNPLFRRRGANRIFALYLSLVLGVPQSIWRARHLWHHAGEPVGRRLPAVAGSGLVELAAVGAAWSALLLLAPRFFLGAYLPGFAAGMALCLAQGRFEHLAPAGQAGISFYGRFYNLLWFNDGYHAEHHARPQEPWHHLPTHRLRGAQTSRWPPVLRWLDGLAPVAALLDGLERLALAWAPLQRWLVASHGRAFARLTPRLAAPPRLVAVVGGGLFPRTVLVLRSLFPGLSVRLVDGNLEHLERARAYLATHGGLDGIELIHARFEAGLHGDVDLVVLPLGYRGDRAAAARSASTPVLCHDWLWQRRGDASVPVSLLLLKRLSLHLPTVRAGR